MFKRFMIGFIVGLGSMYWYIHHGGDTLSDANGWMQRSASHYRNDKMHQAVDAETGRSRR